MPEKLPDAVKAEIEDLLREAMDAGVEMGRYHERDEIVTQLRVKASEVELKLERLSKWAWVKRAAYGAAVHALRYAAEEVGRRGRRHGV